MFRMKTILGRSILRQDDFWLLWVRRLFNLSASLCLTIRVLRLCDMFNPRTAIVSPCPLTTTIYFAITMLASLLDIDHDILTQPVIILDILPMLDDWTRRSRLAVRHRP